MKMPYEKPMMAIERYELTQSIATCETKIGFNSAACVKKDPDATPQMKDFAWSDGWFNSDCADGYVVTPGDGEDFLCYHTNANAAFSS